MNAGLNSTMSLPQTIARNCHPVTPHEGMTQPHDHLGATYRLLPQTRDDAYAVEVSVRGMSPTTVSGFITQASAERWVAERRHGAVPG